MHIQLCLKIHFPKGQQPGDHQLYSLFQSSGTLKKGGNSDWNSFTEGKQDHMKSWRWQTWKLYASQLIGAWECSLLYLQSAQEM